MRYCSEYAALLPLSVFVIELDGVKDALLVENLFLEELLEISHPLLLVQTANG